MDTLNSLESKTYGAITHTPPGSLTAMYNQSSKKQEKNDMEGENIDLSKQHEQDPNQQVQVQDDEHEEVDESQQDDDDNSSEDEHNEEEFGAIVDSNEYDDEEYENQREREYYDRMRETRNNRSTTNAFRNFRNFNPTANRYNTMNQNHIRRRKQPCKKLLKEIKYFFRALVRYSDSTNYEFYDYYNDDLERNDSTEDDDDDDDEDYYYIDKAKYPELILYFWVATLSLAYAFEKITFKILIDRAGPFRLFSAEIITSVHAIILILVMISIAIVRKKFQFAPLNISLTNIIIMALLDVIHLLFAIVTAANVPPVLTVILVQTTLPLTNIFQFFLQKRNKNSRDFNENNNTEESHLISNNNNNQRSVLSSSSSTSSPFASMQHKIGTTYICWSILIGLVPILLRITTSSSFLFTLVSSRTAWQTLLFALTCIPASISTVYKENCMLQYKHPINMELLNIILYIFQCMIAFWISPLFFSLQGFNPYDKNGQMGLDSYPLSMVSQNMRQGFQCFFGDVDKDVEDNTYICSANCSGILLLSFGYIISVCIISIAVDKIVHICSCLDGNTLISSSSPCQSPPIPIQQQHQNHNQNQMSYQSNNPKSSSPTETSIMTGSTRQDYDVGGDDNNKNPFKIMYRGIHIGMAIALFILYFYGMHTSSSDSNIISYIVEDDNSLTDGGEVQQQARLKVIVMHLFYLVSSIILIIGSEIYHDVPIASSTYETVFPTVENIFGDEE